MESLRGQLLISSGRLYDDNFRHTVVLIGEHDRDGAVGVILNRPTEYLVDDAVPPLAELVPPGDPLFEGGPVEPAQPVLLADLSDASLLDRRVFESVGFLTGEVPATVRAQVQRARVYAGHAGWGPGQLEAELEQDAWILHPATADRVFDLDPSTLWRRILEEKGPPYSALARIPFDPSMN